MGWGPQVVSSQRRTGQLVFLKSSHVLVLPSLHVHGVSAEEPLGSQGCCSFVAHSAKTAPCDAGGGLLPLGSGYDFLTDP